MMMVSVAQLVAVKAMSTIQRKTPGGGLDSVDKQLQPLQCVTAAVTRNGFTV